METKIKRRLFAVSVLALLLVSLFVGVWQIKPARATVTTYFQNGFENGLVSWTGYTRIVIVTSPVLEGVNASQNQYDWNDANCYKTVNGIQGISDITYNFTFQVSALSSTTIFKIAEMDNVYGATEVYQLFINTSQLIFKRFYPSTVSDSYSGSFSINTWYNLIIHTHIASGTNGYYDVYLNENTSTIIHDSGIDTTGVNPSTQGLQFCVNYDGAFASMVTWDEITISDIGYPTIPDTTAPTYSGLSVSNNIANMPAIFKITVMDETSLGAYSFSTNNSGSWVYDSAISFGSNPQTVSVSKTLNPTIGKIVGYRWNFTDSSGNANDTGILTLTTRGWVLPTWDSGVEATADYIIWQNATSAYVNRTSDDTIVYSTTNIQDIFSYAASHGKNVAVRPATYTSTGVCYWNNNDSIITFEQGALLTPANGVNAPIFQVYNSGAYGYGYRNITIQGIQIDGNWLNTGLSSSGLVVLFSSNVTVIGANITKCRMYGIEVYSEGSSYPAYNCTVKDSLITFAAWNGITFYDYLANYDSKQSVVNTEVAYCSDVGISIYTKGCTVKNNFLHDMNGTYNTQAHYGIDTEAETGAEGGYNFIYNNTIINGGSGIACEGSRANLVKGNYIDCATGIFINNDGYNVVTQNAIVNYSSGYNFGIAVYWGKNNIVSFNTIGSDTGSNDIAIYVHNSTNMAIMNNTVTSPGVAIGVETHTNNAIIKTNTVHGITGITIGDSSCINDTLVGNIYVSCTYDVADSGTGTRINPTSSDNYTLTLDDTYYDGTINPIAGRYSYANSSSVLITLTPESLYAAVLNVDGTNVTLTSNAYTLGMGVDHVAYAMFDYNGIVTVTVTVTSPTNTTYTVPTVSVQLSASGGTISVIWWNCKNGSSWIYGSNITYTAPTSMTGFVNGTSYTFYAWANNTLGEWDEGTVMFTVLISATPPPPPPSGERKTTIWVEPEYVNTTLEADKFIAWCLDHYISQIAIHGDISDASRAYLASHGFPVFQTLVCTLDPPADYETYMNNILSAYANYSGIIFNDGQTLWDKARAANLTHEEALENYQSFITYAEQILAPHYGVDNVINIACIFSDSIDYALMSQINATQSVFTYYYPPDPTIRYFSNYTWFNTTASGWNVKSFYELYAPANYYQYEGWMLIYVPNVPTDSILKTFNGILDLNQSYRVENIEIFQYSSIANDTKYSTLIKYLCKMWIEGVSSPIVSDAVYTYNWTETYWQELFNLLPDNQSTVTYEGWQFTQSNSNFTYAVSDGQFVLFWNGSRSEAGWGSFFMQRAFTTELGLNMSLEFTPVADMISKSIIITEGTAFDSLGVYRFGFGAFTFDLNFIFFNVSRLETTINLGKWTPNCPYTIQFNIDMEGCTVKIENSTWTWTYTIPPSEFRYNTINTRTLLVQGTIGNLTDTNTVAWTMDFTNANSLTLWNPPFEFLNYTAYHQDGFYLFLEDGLLANWTYDPVQLSASMCLYGETASNLILNCTEPTSVLGNILGYSFLGDKLTIELSAPSSSQSVSVSWKPVYVEPVPPLTLPDFLPYLWAGDFFGFIIAVYTSSFGSVDIFFGVVIILVMVPLYIRTKSLMFMSILWILLGSLFLIATPLISGLAVLLLVLGIGSMLFELFMINRRG